MNETTRNSFLAMLGAVVCAVLVCVVVFACYWASHTWGNGNPANVQLRIQKQRTLTDLQQQCLVAHGNWSTPNGQDGRCVFN
jgi:hypothetical protein